MLDKQSLEQLLLRIGQCLLRHVRPICGDALLQRAAICAAFAAITFPTATQLTTATTSISVSAMLCLRGYLLRLNE